MDENFELDSLQTPSKFKKPLSKSRELLSIPPSPFMEKLGYGTGVNVWKLTHSPKVNSIKSPWAIKNIRKNINESLSNKYQSLLKNEADILKSLNHENIIGFRGYLKSHDGRNCLAMEVGGDSLGNMIEERLENDLGPFPPHNIIKVALGVAKALEYLHNEKKILHGDLKSYNVVIKNNYEEVKLCDFGVSLNLNDPEISKKYVGTPIYSAPECQGNDKGSITEKSDIFSFGLILFEMMSLMPPHVEDLMDENEDSFCNSELNNSNFSESDSNECDGEEKYGTRPALPLEDLNSNYQQIIEIFFACTEQDPDKRPSASILVEHLNTLIQQHHLS